LDHVIGRVVKITWLCCGLCLSPMQAQDAIQSKGEHSLDGEKGRNRRQNQLELFIGKSGGSSTPIVHVEDFVVVQVLPSPIIHVNDLVVV
jgi:hypothetical protein